MDASVEASGEWVCEGCLTRQPQGARSCIACGRPLASGRIGRAARRAVMIAIGVALQTACGLLLWLHPPGTPLAWLVYVGVGAVGAAHILAGAFMWRTPAVPGAECERALVTAFVPGDLPFHAKHCRACGAGLAEAIAEGRRRCPNCRSHFRLADLGWMQEDPRGEPLTLAPGEQRLDGRVLAAVFALLLILVLAGLHMLTIMSTPAPAGP